MASTPRVNAARNSGLQDDHDPNDIGQNDRAKKGQGIVRDERGQEQPADKKRAQQTSKTDLPQVSQSGQNSGYSSDADTKKGNG